MRSAGRVLGVVGAIVCLTTGLARAQTTAQSTEVKKFEVIAVDGNTLVVRLPEGTRELTVADDFRFTIDGKQMSVHELRPGMAGTATITTKTTTTPVTVTEIKSGTIAAVSGSSVIVRTGDEVRSFSQNEIDKRGIKIFRSGKPAQLSQFRPGDQFSATIITSQPPRVVTEQEVQATLAASGNAAPARAASSATPSSPASSAARTGAAPVGTTASGSSTPAAGGSQARTLPRTAGPLPLLGLVGVALLGLGA